ncbi:MAG: phosphoenolpyruvate--protein phosphotransferase [Chloroflexi bacterium AL-W]|nr:phosphoenolpyruvate--protein phosphotransferase [Chloroflexi bacterium AL-N1]NOK69686.1 phosphoenolpyruvate--protein phosphotransferase [Chloroflexi bacterium AL-N10]NOK72233.1 phosphoenolpyruvate--protein phosphotransferase [Chloroflexi bacterium AL-N5]NOK85062.1 phosphoenolpyruvate--protein phosphotransferase [Chloroflexi bacterium AL-W]NOK91815.1 phosphoenolpyruvate--protein phosphotransferase [Chloroflexi bacterium AL-N15]
MNAKSLISVLTLGVTHGQQIQVEVSDEDEEAAAAAIVAAVRDGLGEGPHEGNHVSTAAPAKGGPGPPTRTTPLANVVFADGDVMRGVAGAPGIAIGPIFHFERAQVEVCERFVSFDHEIGRLQTALEAARQQLVTLHTEVAQRADDSEAEIFQVHRDILSDPALIDNVRAAITDGRSAAEAWHGAMSDHATELADLSDALLAERATDIRDVGQRVLRLLTGAEDGTPTLPDTPVIIVANDLTPLETVALDPARVLGFCMAVGGPNAHTAILARALGLPAVVSAGAGILQRAAAARL